MEVKPESISCLLQGDIVYVKRGLYKHYGIYIGDNKVIHFAPLQDEDKEINAKNAVIHETTLQKFLKEGKLEIDRESRPKFSRAEIVQRAKSQIGTKGYNLAFSNCEHFARWSATGSNESKQVEEVLDIVVNGIMYTKDIIQRNVNPEDGIKLFSKISEYIDSNKKE